MQIRRYLPQIPITLLISGFVIVAHFAGESSSLLTIDFRSITPSDLHRVFTCHLLHWSANHLLWDLGMFTTLGAIAEVNMPRRYRLTLLVSALLIPIGVIQHHPELQTYRGLSGIDTALFGLIVVDLLGRRLVERAWKAASWLSLLLIGLFAKMLTETHAGTNIFVSDLSFVPVPIAHLIGAVIGLIIGSASYAMIPPRRLRKCLASSAVDPGLWRSLGTRSEGEVVGKD
ncbi:MAG: rhombosortase [Planctomycetota bacterium]|nr:rhombosortase [Planctomycetota bacterium]